MAAKQFAERGFGKRFVKVAYPPPEAGRGASPQARPERVRRFEAEERSPPFPTMPPFDPEGANLDCSPQQTIRNLKMLLNRAVLIVVGDQL
jgi:hypothetical protein